MKASGCELDQRGQARQNRRSKAMGEIRASVKLENSWDRENVERGLGVEADVRGTTVEGIVDTGAGESGDTGGNRTGTGTPPPPNENRRLRGRTAKRTPGDGGHDQAREPCDRYRGNCGNSRERGPDRTGRTRDARPHRRLQEPDTGAAASGRAGPGPALGTIAALTLRRRSAVTARACLAELALRRRQPNSALSPCKSEFVRTLNGPGVITTIPVPSKIPHVACCHRHARERRARRSSAIMSPPKDRRP